MHGQVHLKMGGITQRSGGNHAFAQIYILDSSQQVNARLKLPGITGKNGCYTKEAKITLNNYKTCSTNIIQ